MKQDGDRRGVAGEINRLEAALSGVKMRRRKRDRGDKFITSVAIILARNRPALD